MTENTKDSLFQLIRQRDLAQIEKAMGITFTDLGAIETTFGEGMKMGTVSFAAGDGKDGIFGSLHCVTQNEHGDKIRKNLPITNSAEAAFLLGLQIKADKQNA